MMLLAEQVLNGRQYGMMLFLMAAGLILVFSEGTRWLFGSFPLHLSLPPVLSGTVTLPGGLVHPAFRLAIIGIGAGVAAGLFGAEA